MYAGYIASLSQWKLGYLDLDSTNANLSLVGVDHSEGVGLLLHRLSAQGGSSRRVSQKAASR
jgi:hypothetical protein